MKKQFFLFFGFAFFLFVLFISLFIFTRNQMQSSSEHSQPIPPQRDPRCCNAQEFANSIGTTHNLPPISSPSPKTPEVMLVTRVIDGDTIEIEGGRKVRYIGIDTPELTDKRKLVKCFAERARAKNKELVEGRIVLLVRDISETDRYGRLLRYVYRDDIFINTLLVEEGYAYAASFPPDTAYQEKLREMQQAAREKKLGLWENTCM